MSPDEYIRNRLDEQQKWFSCKSTENQREYKRLRRLETACVLLLPVLGMLPIADPWRDIILVLLSVIASYLRFFAGLDSCHDLWLQYRAASEALKREKLLYETRTGVYRGDDSGTVLVMRVESIIASVNGDWLQIKQDEPPTPHSSTGS